MCAVLMTACCVSAGTADASPVQLVRQNDDLKTASSPQAPSHYRGWDYLVKKLIKTGLTESEVRKIYGSSNMPYFSNVSFVPRPVEAPALYAHFANKRYIEKAKDFLRTYQTVFKRAEQHYHVERYIVAALLLIETHFGENTGTQVVLERLSRVASVGEPENLEWNFKRLVVDDPTVTREILAKRAEYLEGRFFPEIPALIEIAKRNRVNIFNIRGSIAGAFGIPQFLPTNYLKFGVDANRDGRVSLFTEADAIWSTANFLAFFGWKNELSLDEKREVVWHYNHSDPYVETALTIAEILKVAA